MGLVYISKSGVVLGPYDEKLIPDLMDRGVIDKTDLATPEGSEDWVNVIDYINGVNAPQTHAPVVMNAPEIRSKSMTSEAPQSTQRRHEALPKPLAHEPVGGTGVTSPALNLYQTRSSSSVDSFLKRKRKPWVTALLNLLMPGVGYFYLGKWADGLVVAAALGASFYFFTTLDWLWMIAPVAYFVGVISSVSATRRHNFEAATELGLNDEEAPPQFFLPIFVLVMAILFMALYFHKNNPESTGDLVAMIPKNITGLLPEAVAEWLRR